MSRTRDLLTTLLAGVAVVGMGTAIAPTLAQPPAENPASPSQEKPVDIIETARKNPRLRTFVSAVEAAGLTDTLKGKGPYTILAPSDDAFRKLPAETLADLQKPENKEKLASILKYHVIVGRYTSGDLMNQQDKALLRTVNGSPVTLSKLPTVKFNDKVGVTAQDIAAENGVIHVVDTVLLPPVTTAPPVDPANPPADPDKPADPAKPTDPANPPKPDPGTNP